MQFSTFDYDCMHHMQQGFMYVATVLSRGVVQHRVRGHVLLWLIAVVCQAVGVHVRAQDGRWLCAKLSLLPQVKVCIG